MDGQIAMLISQSAVLGKDVYGREAPVHFENPGPARQDLAQEISFFEYRLAVLHSWPESAHRSALIQATVARLQNLCVNL